MRTARSALVVGLVAQITVLATLAGSVGLGALGWVVGIACGVVTSGLLGRGLGREGSTGPGPADWVTLARAVLVGGVAALVADAFVRPAQVQVLVGLTVVALVLDGVDGYVARRTRTASQLGARFDMEVDAFLLLVLSVFVARSSGWWVLAIGAARYVFVGAGWLAPWLRAPLPPRYWRKVVAATQGVVLTVAAAGVPPTGLMDFALAVSLAMLVESFGRDVWWLWQHRLQGGGHAHALQAEDARGRVRTVAAGFVTVLACLLVWFALVAPNQINDLTLGAFARIPLEGLVVVAIIVVLPARARTIVAAGVGVVLGALAIVKVIDMGFFATIDRPFNPVSDWAYLGSAVDLLADAIGRSGAVAAAIAAGVLALALLVLMPLAVVRLTRLTALHRTGSIRVVAGFGTLWVLSALLGGQLVPGAPIASASAAGLAYDQVREIRAGAQVKATLAEAVLGDPFRYTAGADLLTELRGKDVVIAFVESYGRVAVQDSPVSADVSAVLDAGTAELRTAGLGSRSAFLTSSTFGGISWLAHSTLQSGLWIDNQTSYDQVLASDRLTLAGAFKRAGWRTVDVVPSNGENWNEGKAFYGYDKVYDYRTLGYRGPSYSYATMPDQYTLSMLQRLELAPTDRAPVMAEVDLVSSHTPWTPRPRLIDWSDIGDGSVFSRTPADGGSPEAVWRDGDQVRAAYGKTIEYTLSSLMSFMKEYGDDDLVLILVGDHQPATIVSGSGASHDVPITIIARDRAVLEQIADWDWQDGMRPDPQAPVWPMDAFRDRFLTTFGPLAEAPGAS